MLDRKLFIFFTICVGITAFQLIKILPEYVLQNITILKDKIKYNNFEMLAIPKSFFQMKVSPTS